MLLRFVFVYIAMVKDTFFFFSSRLCEVKAFTGSADSLRTPFKDSCEHLSKSEIGYVLFAAFLFA